MSKRIRFTFEKGGTFVADLLEDKAPVTCKVVWEALEKPWDEYMFNSKICGMVVECPYLPIPEDVDVPNENLRHFAKHGDVAVVTTHEYREMSIKGYLPLMIDHGSRESAKETLEHLRGIKLEEGLVASEESDDTILSLFKKTMMETCRANVFAKVIEEDLPVMSTVCNRIRYQGLEGFTVERV